MDTTTRTLLKIFRGLMIAMCIVSMIAILGLVGKIETCSDSMFAYYTKPVITCVIITIGSFGLAKLADHIIKRW